MCACRTCPSTSGTPSPLTCTFSLASGDRRLFLFSNRACLPCLWPKIVFHRKTQAACTRYSFGTKDMHNSSPSSFTLLLVFFFFFFLFSLWPHHLNPPPPPYLSSLSLTLSLSPPPPPPPRPSTHSLCLSHCLSSFFKGLKGLLSAVFASFFFFKGEEGGGLLSAVFNLLFPSPPSPPPLSLSLSLFSVVSRVDVITFSCMAESRKLKTAAVLGRAD